MSFGPFTTAVIALTDKQIIRRLHETGHFRNSAHSDTWNVQERDVDRLAINDRVVQLAAQSYQDFFPAAFNYFAARIHNRAGDVDGVIGPATRALIGMERCRLPDFTEAVPDKWITGEATGAGNWRGCHDVGEFHSAVCMIDDRRMTEHYKEVWLDVLKASQACDAAMGLLWRFVDTNGRDMLNGEDLSGEFVDTRLTFAHTSSGWIGLAIVGKGLQCREREIWLQLLNTYGSSYSRAQRVNQLAWLLTHELTHNKGYGHARSGIQAPALGSVNRPPNWFGDELEEWHKGQYGGVPVPIPGSGPPQPKGWTHLILRDENYPADDFTMDLDPPWPRGGEEPRLLEMRPL